MKIFLITIILVISVLFVGVYTYTSLKPTDKEEICITTTTGRVGGLFGQTTTKECKPIK